MQCNHYKGPPLCVIREGRRLAVDDDRFKAVAHERNLAQTKLEDMTSGWFERQCRQRASIASHTCLVPTILEVKRVWKGDWSTPTIVGKHRLGFTRRYLNKIVTREAHVQCVYHEVGSLLACFKSLPKDQRRRQRPPIGKQIWISGPLSILPNMEVSQGLS